MRQLIRPALFWVARIGLFLAVLGWLVGQWTSIFFNAPIYYRSTQFYMQQSGWFLTVEHDPGSVQFLSPLDELQLRELRVVFSGTQAEVKANALSCRTWRLCRGLCVFQDLYDDTFYGISLPHWLIVTIFALFYGVLKWVYRKRPEVARE